MVLRAAFARSGCVALQESKMGSQMSGGGSGFGGSMMGYPHAGIPSAMPYYGAAGGYQGNVCSLCMCMTSNCIGGWLVAIYVVNMYPTCALKRLPPASMTCRCRQAQNMLCSLARPRLHMISRSWASLRRL